MIDKSIKIIEKRRWEESLEEGYNEMLNGLINNASSNIEDYRKQVEKLSNAASINQWLINFAFRECDKLYESHNDIPLWNRYLTAIRVLCNKFNEGMFTKLFISVLGLSTFRKRVSDWLLEVNQSIPTLYQFFNDSDKYLTHYGSSKKAANGQNGPPDEILVLYASYKTWQTDNEFDSFVNSVEKSLPMAIHLYIESPIQLFLDFSSNHFSIFIKTLLFENINFGKDSDTMDLRLLFKYIEDLIKDSKTLKYMISLQKEMAKKAAASWKEENIKRRKVYPTVDQRKRFITNFELGIFHN